MPNYKIAGLIVHMEPKRQKSIIQSDKYLIKESIKPDIFLNLDEENIIKMKEKYTHLSLEDCEYMLLGSMFYEKLLLFNGCLLHASAVVYENKTYLFSADSGVGKSTHTSLWLKYFGEDKALIINDDKPAIRFIDGKYIVYGTPFSGKTDLNENISVPLHSICFIEQSDKNWINSISAKEAFKLVMQQTIRPNLFDNMDKLLFFLNHLLSDVKIYKMGCNINEEAVILSYNTMK